MFKFISIILFFILFTYKVNSEIVKNIEVINNNRVSKETILIFAKIEIGKNYSQNDLNFIIQELYKTDFFSNIILEIKDGTLIIDIEENKIIQQVDINGIKKSEIVNLLKKKISTKDRNPFLENNILSDVILMRKILKNSGFYFSEITETIVENDNNTVNVVFDVKLGEKAFIKKIQFIGDKVYKDRTLRGVIASEEDRFWKFITKDRFINPDLIKLDKRLLKKFYLNKGHYQVAVSDSFIEYTNNNYFKLVYNINAGPKFIVDKASLSLPIDYDEKDFSDVKKRLNKLEGEYYSINKMKKIADEVEKLTLTNDYEFLDASFNEKILSDNKLNLIFQIKEFPKQYLSQINIFGNNITEEKVIRDNLSVDEGDPFNKLLLAKSMNNLRALNIFGKVDYSLDTVEEDKKILNISIEEKPTGEISAGAGTGTQGSTFGFGIKENNFLGKNIMFDTNLRVTEETIKGKFSVINPKWNYTDKLLKTSIESSTTDRMADFGYETGVTGFVLGAGWEQYEDVYFSPEVSSFYEKLETNQTASAKMKDQEGEYFDINFAYKLDLDKRNQRYQTTDGYRSRFSQRIPLLSEDYAFLNSYDYTTFNQFGDMVTRVGFLARTINSISGDDVRISKRLYIPTKRLRGFESMRIGPVDSGDYIGGNHTAVFNASTTLPDFGANLEKVDFQVFFDAANVWGVDYDSSLDNSTIRSSTGFSVDWYTVIGPLNFSIAQPLSKASSDKTETFRFNIGTTF
tara:strand:- start:1000 stop:3228 length:2229 start_codon:yes stop_codon:yes gene_type:complete